MLHSGKLKSKVNCTYEKALRTAYSKYKISLNKLFDEGAPFTIHQRNVLSLVTEIFKYL